MSDFLMEVQGCVPSLRRYARALTRDPDAADDLVQDCLERAISRRLLWRRSGSLRAWLFTMMHNIHANDVRYRAIRPVVVSIDDTHFEGQSPAEQGGALALRDMEAALDRLPPEQRQAVLLVALEGLTYQQVAEVAGVPVALSCRVCRGAAKRSGL